MGLGALHAASAVDRPPVEQPAVEQLELATDENADAKMIGTPPEVKRVLTYLLTYGGRNVT